MMFRRKCQGTNQLQFNVLIDVNKLNILKTQKVGRPYTPLFSTFTARINPNFVQFGTKKKMKYLFSGSLSTLVKIPVLKIQDF